MCQRQSIGLGASGGKHSCLWSCSVLQLPELRVTAGGSKRGEDAVSLSEKEPSKDTAVILKSRAGKAMGVLLWCAVIAKGTV